MNKLLNYLFYIIIIVNSSCTTNSNKKQDKLKGFVINGTVNGFKDNTWIYLEDESQHNLIATDSTLIKNGKFHFKGFLKQEACEVQIFIKTSEDSRSFWLENSVINFSAKRENFKDAVITGSKTQIEAEKLDAITSVFRNEAWGNIKQLSKKISFQTKKALMKKNDSLMSKELFTTKNFVKNNPNSIISASYLSFYASEWGKSFVETTYKSFPANIKNSSYGKDIFDYLKLNKDLKIGDHYADFEQQSSSGEMVKLSKYTGKLTLLEFWASWCNPCREDNPKLVKIYNEFKTKGLEIVAVSADNNKNNWLQAIKQDKLPWPQVCNLKGDKNDAVIMYGVNKFPSNFLIDEKGIIIAQDLRGEELNKKLAELLK